jgi:hypothetical protein
LTTSFGDIEDASLTYTVTGNTNPDLFVSLQVNDTTGELTIYHDPTTSGVGELTVRATDAGGLFVESAFTVTVNAAPQAQGIRNLDVAEDSATTVHLFERVFHGR